MKLRVLFGFNFRQSPVKLEKNKQTKKVGSKITSFCVAISRKTMP